VSFHRGHRRSYDNVGAEVLFFVIIERRKLNEMDSRVRGNDNTPQAGLGAK
jgi:hypothetical protein